MHVQIGCAVKQPRRYPEVGQRSGLAVVHVLRNGPHCPKRRVVYRKPMSCFDELSETGPVGGR